jgi:hypothetical protein
VPYSSNLKKQELQERLNQAIQNGVLVPALGGKPKAKIGKQLPTTDMTGFSWRPLDCTPT